MIFLISQTCRFRRIECLLFLAEFTVLRRYSANELQCWIDDIRLRVIIFVRFCSRPLLFKAISPSSWRLIACTRFFFRALSLAPFLHRVITVVMSEPRFISKIPFGEFIVRCFVFLYFISLLCKRGTSNVRIWCVNASVSHISAASQYW